MSTQTATQMVQWQDLKVKSDVDMVLEIAHQKGWNDCEIFGYGDMITQPLESKGWKLIPADLYEYSIPAVGVDRVLQTIDAGVRIKGVIIADDERRGEPTPANPKVSLPSARTVVAFLGKVLLRLIVVIGVIAILALIGMMMIYAVIILGPLIILGTIIGPGPVGIMDYDPKLIILVDDGNGGTVWVSLLTWYE